MTFALSFESEISIQYHCTGRFIVQRPNDINQPAVDVAFLQDFAPDAIVPVTVERILEVDEIMKELLPVLKMFSVCHYASLVILRHTVTELYTSMAAGRAHFTHFCAVLNCTSQPTGSR